MKQTFEEYLKYLHETVKREPTTETERGFQMAVMMIYAKYKNLK